MAGAKLVDSTGQGLQGPVGSPTLQGPVGCPTSVFSRSSQGAVSVESAKKKRCDLTSAPTERVQWFAAAGANSTAGGPDGGLSMVGFLLGCWCQLSQARSLAGRYPPSS